MVWVLISTSVGWQSVFHLFALFGRLSLLDEGKGQSARHSLDARDFSVDLSSNTNRNTVLEVSAGFNDHFKKWSALALHHDVPNVSVHIFNSKSSGTSEDVALLDELLDQRVRNAREMNFDDGKSFEGFAYQTHF